MSPKKPIVFLGVILGVTILLIIGTYTLLSLVPKDETPAGATQLEPVQNPGTISLLPQEALKIEYSDSGFAPESVAIRADNPGGCVITIKNNTTAIVRFGLNPHNVNGDPGADHGLTAPNEAVILDPRYPGLAEVILHDHARPENELRIIYGEGCR